MADNLETSGVRLVAENADKAIADLGRFNKASDDTSRSVEKLAATSEGGAGLDAVASGAAVAGAALTTLIAIAGAVVAAIGAIGGAINSALAYGSSISRLQDSTGLSGGLAQSLSGGAAISGNSVGALANTFNAFGEAANKAGEQADKALGKVGAAADKAGTRLARLNEDYARSIADITASAAERIQASNDALVAAHESMLQRQARADEDYAREVGDGRAQLAQRLADIDSSANESIAALTERQARANEDYARETENARQDLAQSILDIEQGLADKIEALQYRAAERNTSAIDDGAQAQAKIQEDLQKKLYDIEQKYISKRQSLQEKIYDPNTNPILRAFYKTQLKSIDGLQKAEEDGARSGAAAKEAAQRRETEARLAEIARGLQREEALERQQAQRRVLRLQQEAAQRQAERTREFNQQTGDLATQIARENAQRDQQSARARADQAAREADLRRSYERQTADAQAAYDKQVQDAVVAQAKIQAETEKRLAAEKRQYDRALEDIAASLAASGGGASAAAAGIDKVKRGFDELGISAAEFAKLTPDQQFKLVNDRIGELVSSGHFQEAIQLVQDITGASREQATQYVKNVADMKVADSYLKDLGWTQEQIDNAVEVEKKFNLVKAVIAQVGADIGAIFIPIILDLFRTLESLWKQFKNDLLPAIQANYNFIKQNLERAFGTLATAAQAVWDKLEPVRKLIDALTNVAMAALNLKAREIATFWNDVLRPAIEKVGYALDQTLGNAVRFLVNGVLDDLTRKFEGVKLVLEWLYSKLPNISEFFNNLANSINRVQVPSYANSSNTPTYPTSYNNGFSPQASTRSVPATGAQMAAGSTSTSKTTNTNTASFVFNIANGTKSNVESGVSSALFKAGFTVTK